MPTPAATGPHVLVQRVNGGGIDLLDLGSAEVRQDVPVDGAAIVGDGDGRDRPNLLTPAEPALDQLGDGPGRAPAVLATVHLLQELGLDLLGVSVGPLGLSRDLAADPSLATGERVAAGVRPAPAGRFGACGSRRHPWLVSPVSSQKNDQGMTAEQAKQEENRL